MNHTYDTMLARIAGNIAPALIREMGQQAPETYAAEAVRIARAIVDEVKHSQERAAIAKAQGDPQRGER